MAQIFKKFDVLKNLLTLAGLEKLDEGNLQQLVGVKKQDSFIAGAIKGACEEIIKDLSAMRVYLS